jgi:hypothetical protein
MKNRIALLIFLGVVLAGYSLAQMQTDCSTNGTSSNGQINATTYCRSTDTGGAAAAQAERNRQSAEAGQGMGKALGTRLAAVRLQHEEKKELKKEWQQTGAYCDQHPGENWGRTSPDGRVTSSGVCPGQMRFDVARRVYTGALQAEFAKAGVAGYTKFDGDVVTVHSERASLMRFHAITYDEKFLPWFRTMNVKTYIYTNDADKTFKFDVASNREVTTDTEEQIAKGEEMSAPPAAASKDWKNPAGNIVMPQLECPSGTTLTTTDSGASCK